ncbi:hypothetical protein FIBSPDRAFT_934272 [Athelia psychrophila]|uniref:Uncharacterized protein n=1 Tax=Athelia psychrophila TaxID=1759441 RepID=A0A166FPE6_9AGAM|nr:hypothetical protein FIBSPDRAFT_934272 [Fibularhizoctonia sp. CBS 109695]
MAYWRLTLLSTSLQCLSNTEGRQGGSSKPEEEVWDLSDADILGRRSKVYGHYNVSLERSSGGPKKITYIFTCKHQQRDHETLRRLRIKTGDRTTNLTKQAASCDTARGVLAATTASSHGESSTYTPAAHQVVIALKSATSSRPTTNITAWRSRYCHLDQVSLERKTSRGSSSNEDMDAHIIIIYIATLTLRSTVHVTCHQTVVEPLTERFKPRFQTGRLPVEPRWSLPQQKVSFMEIPPLRPFRPDLAAATKSDQCGGCLHRVLRHTGGLITTYWGLEKDADEPAPPSLGADSPYHALMGL